MAFRSFEAKLVAVPMDEHGLEVDELERRLADGLRPKLLYTHPRPPEPGRRQPLRRTARAARRARAALRLPVVEDVAYRELGFADESLPSLWSLAPDVVVQAGRRRRRSFPASGSAGRSARPTSPRGLSPPSRTPTSARARSDSGSSRSPFAAAGSTSSWCSRERSTGASASACWRRSSAGCRRRALDAAAGRLLLLAHPARRRRRRDLARRAVEPGVGIVPGTLFFPDGRGADTVRLSFSLVDEAQIDEGIARLGALL